MDNGFQVGLSRIRWDYFGTMTFAKVPRSVCQRTIALEFLRESAAFHGVHFDHLLWVLRLEAGEIGGRLHYHTLIAGVPPYRVTERACLTLMNIGEKSGYGICRFRVFNPLLDGVGYVLKGLDSSIHRCGGNVYELTKFGTADVVTISKSVLRVMSARRSQEGSAVNNRQRVVVVRYVPTVARNQVRDGLGEALSVVA